MGDTDAYDGKFGTTQGFNSRGTQVSLAMALAENSTLVLTQYLIDSMDNSMDNATDVFGKTYTADTSGSNKGQDHGLNKVVQCDINVKF
jgi:carbamate kinase